MPGAHYGGGAVVCPLTVRVCLHVCVCVCVHACHGVSKDRS